MAPRDSSHGVGGVVVIWLGYQIESPVVEVRFRYPKVLYFISLTAPGHAPRSLRLTNWYFDRFDSFTVLIPAERSSFFNLSFLIPKNLPKSFTVIVPSFGSVLIVSMSLTSLFHDDVPESLLGLWLRPLALRRHMRPVNVNWNLQSI